MHLRADGRAALGVLAALLAASCEEPPPPPPPPPPPKPVVVAPPPEPEPLELPERPLVLGRPPHLAQNTKHENAALVAYLSRALGHPIEVRVPASYHQTVELLADGSLDLAMLTPLTYVEARDRVPDLRLLCSVIAEGGPKYNGYIVTKIESPLTEVAQLKGKRFAFVDRSSASGYLFPRLLLHEQGLVPERDFGAVVFLGSHPAVVKAVLAGEVDAGVVSSTTYRHMRDEDLQQKLRIIAKTDFIPLDAFVASASLSEGVAAKLQQTLIELDARTEAGRQVLSGITTINGFVFGNDSAYDSVRAAAKVLRASSR